ncbi:hypothetical protein GGQ64_004195 [Rhizobium azooxidifex]|uniref:Uncharacterized protein n=1 Tax=Mycoplana azooxidifex TaxID=1636188 RepID=A0A7W6DH74_9HYPH|nr:hypothetical protein [Mycoplana azooxidifex]MBB3978959.1 hypothetical protein [Mycoplana azooxidifex]
MSDFLEYSFRITGPTTETLSMARLATYMSELARLMGCMDSVHLGRIDDGSVVIVAAAPQSEVPIISPRIRSAATGEPSAEANVPWRRINEYLAEDGWGGEMRLPRSAEVIPFPGKSKSALAIRAMSQPTSVQGRLVRLEGAGEMVRIGLEIDGDLTARISIDAHSAQRLASFFHHYVRLSGEGRWKRDSNGKWTLDNLVASSFEVLNEDELKDVLLRLGEAIPPGTGKGIIKAINELRSA